MYWCFLIFPNHVRHDPPIPGDTETNLAAGTGQRGREPRSPHPAGRRRFQRYAQGRRETQGEP